MSFLDTLLCSEFWWCQSKGNRTLRINRQAESKNRNPSDQIFTRGTGTPSITREQGEQAQKDGNTETMGTSHFYDSASMFPTLVSLLLLLTISKTKWTPK